MTIVLVRCNENWMLDQVAPPLSPHSILEPVLCAQEVHDELMLAYVVRKAFVALRTGFIYRGSTEGAINPNIW